MKNKMVLTNSAVQRLEIKAKSYEIRDSELRGFLVRIYPSGKKVYRCNYRRGANVTIGDAAALSATQARLQAKQIVGDAAKGLEPQEKAMQKKRLHQEALAKSMTLKHFVLNEYAPWYLASFPRTGVQVIKDIERNFLTAFGHLQLKDIDQKLLEKWRIKRLQMLRKRLDRKTGVIKTVPIRPSTVNRNVEKLSAILNKAVEFGYLSENSIRKVKKLKVEKPHRVRFLKKNEYRQLLKALDRREVKLKSARSNANQWRFEHKKALYPDLSKQAFVDYLKPMVLLALGSGIRFGSLVRLEWEKHISLKEDYAMIRLTADIVKTGKAYEVPLDVDTSNALKQWYEQTYDKHGGEGWVFPGKKPGAHITTVKNSWRKLLNDAGIEDFRWHDQRHDYASQHVMSGTDLYTVMELLGHSDPKMTKKYAHLATEHKVNAVQQLAKRREGLLE